MELNHENSQSIWNLSKSLVEESGYEQSAFVFQAAQGAARSGRNPSMVSTVLILFCNSSPFQRSPKRPFSHRGMQTQHLLSDTPFLPDIEAMPLWFFWGVCRLGAIGYEYPPSIETFVPSIAGPPDVTPKIRVANHNSHIFASSPILFIRLLCLYVWRHIETPFHIAIIRLFLMEWKCHLIACSSSNRAVKGLTPLKLPFLALHTLMAADHKTVNS